MTDMLQERFAALADASDDSDWLDVRRRSRRGKRRYAGAVVAAAAAAVAAAALAGGTGWLFSSHDRAVTARTHVSLHGRTWAVSITTAGGRRLLRVCVRVSRPGGPTLSGGCTWTRSRRLGPPFGARHFDVEGGQIWVGAAVGFTRRISITDVNGRVHSTPAIDAPRGTKTPFRYWALAIAAPARAITAYGAAGRAISRRL